MPRPFTHRLLIALACAGAVAPAFGPTDAAAQSEDELAKARRAFRQGLSLEAAGDWAGALAKFEEVARVRLTPQVRFHMARCKEELGRLNEALGEYRLAEYEAEEAGAKELAEISAAREKLEARVPKLLISRGEGLASARIELDGVQLGAAQLGKEVSVDPGTHTILVRLAGGERFEQQVEVAEGEVKEVELVIPDDLIPAPTDGPPPDDSDDPSGVPDVAAEPGSPLPWIIGGVGAASLVASGVFYLMMNGVENELNDGCRGSVCPQSLEDKQSSGETYAMLTNVTLGVGLVGLGVAAVMLLTQGESSPAPADARGLRVDVGSSSAFSGVTLRGSF
ncbi:MAG: PEGA domain-containing protein [Polyangiaceae bacterium]|nr:PEGA domain-containing protein [Polyangiaceae bacterium]